MSRGVYRTGQKRGIEEGAISKKRVEIYEKQSKEEDVLRLRLIKVGDYSARLVAVDKMGKELFGGVIAEITSSGIKTVSNLNNGVPMEREEDWGAKVTRGHVISR